MIEFRRILLVDWYLFRVEQIDFSGMTALIGPNGSGKSAIIDAVQTVLTGANMTSIRFNASAQSASRSKRSIRDYCLGVVSLDEKGERSQPTREHAYTYAILGFIDDENGDAINLGVAFSANAARGDESCEARFLVRGGLISQEDILEKISDNEVETRQWHAVRTSLRARDFVVEDGFGSASEFVAESLRALSPPGFPLDPRRFIKAFRNALLLKPVENPTEFVRTYVLDVPSIKVERLRQSIELYRFLTERITNLKAQTASLIQIQRIVSRTNENERIIRMSEWQIARLYWERFHREVRRLQSDLKRLAGETQTKYAESLRAASKASRLDADYTRVELGLKSSDAEQLASMYESDRSRVVAERENAMAPVKRLEYLVSRIETLTERRVIAGRDDILHGLLAAVALTQAPLELKRWGTGLPENWETLSIHMDESLSAVTPARLVAIQKVAAQSLFSAQKEVQDLQDRIEQIDHNIKRVEEGLSPIDAGTSALLNALKSAGIHAEPLCDIVDILDQKWRLAAEAVLGRSREALIVAPERAIEALEIFRRGDEYAYRNAEVVNTTKTAQTRTAEKGTLATVIATENKHARAFLDYRIGRLLMVDSMTKVLASENAITPDRMMNSGRTVKRLSHPGQLKLGRGTGETLKLLQEEKTDLLTRLAEKARTAERLREDSAFIDEVVRGFNEMRLAGNTCQSLAKALADFDRSIAELNKSVDEAKRSRDPKLIEELERLRKARDLAHKEKSLAEKEWQTANGAENRVLGTYEKLLNDDFGKLRDERREKAQLLRQITPVKQAEVRFETAVRKLAPDAMTGEIEGQKADVHRRSGERRQSLQRELSAALSRHCQDFSVSIPFSESDAAAGRVGIWAEAERERLESHELVQYEDQCRNASGEMMTAFRDDLLHRLHDAFEGIKDTLSELNRHLKGRLFHGRDYYTFKSIPEPSHADMLELVRESRRPEFTLPLFENKNADEPDGPIARAVRRIEQILADPQAKTEEIEDPRKYFNFELYIHDEQGKIRSSLTSRAGTGSGGEGQLPFYIAIGASLAATYQNRRTEQFGLALAIFDEAFNRLDTKAICACSDFMKSLGLQVVLATPDEKRHIFMEVADTLVNVNRSDNFVLVETEYLTEKTRLALADVDPYRKGFDVYKKELIAAAEREEYENGKRAVAE